MLNLKNMFNTFQDIYEPSRGGVRGGHDQFSWDEVKTDKDRENYLGHSIKAPVGRSQGGPDFLWYTKNREKKTVEKLSISDEKKKVIEMEQLAMSRALGPAYSLLTKNAATPSHPFIMTPAEKKKPKVEPKKSNVKGREKNSKPVEKHAKQRVTPDRKCKNLQNKSEKKIRKSSPKKRDVEIEPKYKVRRERDRSTKIPKRKSPIKDKESRSERHRKKY